MDTFPDTDARPDPDDPDHDAASGPAGDGEAGDGEAGDAAEDEPARHCSTGKLTVAQAGLVDRWRRQLTVPDPRWHTPDQRPPASSSDCIAAAVVDLLDHAEPDHLSLIRYAARIRETLARERGRGFPAASVASFYLPATYAARADDLLTAAYDHHAGLLDQARDQVRTELPDRDQAIDRALRLTALTAAQNIPARIYKLPVGTLARLAIDRWARRAPTTVVAAAVAHGARHHRQLHRARRDMGTGPTSH
ncbi:hypothetical protein IU414_27235 [Nocardia farcinica]|uniref:hypothetical protein n=1 Tax=Nocardia TaxID=1817 RepID=UPI00031ECD82|nr:MULTISPECIES: hypothetical protein [Nocardia]MBF6588441.1 hypothetical protein [Nocardia farcinica]